MAIHTLSSRLGTAQNLSSTASSSATAAFGAQTNQIMVVSTAAVNIRISEGTPTAVATDTLLPANTVIYLTVTPGQKLAAIGTATVNVTELS
jgi:hypothetical protein